MVFLLYSQPLPYLLIILLLLHVPMLLLANDCWWLAPVLLHILFKLLLCIQLVSNQLLSTHIGTFKSVIVDILIVYLTCFSCLLTIPSACSLSALSYSNFGSEPHFIYHHIYFIYLDPNYCLVDSVSVLPVRLFRPPGGRDR